MATTVIGCDICLAHWAGFRVEPPQPVPLGVGAHADLFRCRACGAHWLVPSLSSPRLIAAVEAAGLVEEFGPQLPDARAAAWD